MDTLDYCSHTGSLGRLSLAEASPAAADMIVNRTFEELVIGDFAQIVRTLTQDDIELFDQRVGGRQSCSSRPCLRRRDQVSRRHRPWNAWRVAVFDRFGDDAARGRHGIAFPRTCISAVLSSRGTRSRRGSWCARCTPVPTASCWIAFAPTRMAGRLLPAPRRSLHRPRKCVGGAWRCLRYRWCDMRHTTNCWRERAGWGGCRPLSCIPVRQRQPARGDGGSSSGIYRADFGRP